LLGLSWRIPVIMQTRFRGSELSPSSCSFDPAGGYHSCLTS
jgi:hypothetical protein